MLLSSRQCTLMRMVAIGGVWSDIGQPPEFVADRRMPTMLATWNSLVAQGYIEQTEAGRWLTTEAFRKVYGDHV